MSNWNGNLQDAAAVQNEIGVSTEECGCDRQLHAGDKEVEPSPRANKVPSTPHGDHDKDSADDQIPMY
jgi:hypothetical protein